MYFENALADFDFYTIWIIPNFVFSLDPNEIGKER